MHSSHAPSDCSLSIRHARSWCIFNFIQANQRYSERIAALKIASGLGLSLLMEVRRKMVKAEASPKFVRSGGMGRSGNFGRNILAIAVAWCCR